MEKKKPNQRNEWKNVCIQITDNVKSIYEIAILPRWWKANERDGGEMSTIISNATGVPVRVPVHCMELDVGASQASGLFVATTFFQILPNWKLFWKCFGVTVKLRKFSSPSWYYVLLECAIQFDKCKCSQSIFKII